jgi:PilZ domain-containing protein
MAERRDKFRLSASGTAKIIGARGETPIHCTVHDISGSGCSPAVNALVRLPESFQHVPDDDNSLGYPCRVVWRKGSRVGES